MSGKPAKLVASKTLSGLAGVADVSFGSATPESRMAKDHSKDGARSKPSGVEFDDHKERDARWARGLL